MLSTVTTDRPVMKQRIDAIANQLDQVILGKPEIIRLALCCILARGHLLIEDIPGVGKTTLANALAKTLGLKLNRIQFTSDLLPADILGNAIFDREAQRFTFHPGPVFANLVLADEVNRATPKTQSALLEAMEEHHVSVDGATHALPEPFVVIATQNPSTQIGTFPLPESQLDRFLMRLEMGYPDRAAERDMLRGPNRQRMVAQLTPVIAAGELAQLQAAIEQITVSEPLLDYLLDLLARSRERGRGLSPRAALAMRRASQAWAAMEGRTMVIPEDVQAVAPSIMCHRLGTWGDASGHDGLAQAADILATVGVP
jgi:MoxR-like ATPase